MKPVLQQVSNTACRNKTPFHLFSVKSLQLTQLHQGQLFPACAVHERCKQERAGVSSQPRFVCRAEREQKQRGEKTTHTKKGTWNWSLPPGLTLIPRRLCSALAQPDTGNEEAEETGGGGGGTVKLKTNSLRAGQLGKLWEQQGMGARERSQSLLLIRIPHPRGCSGV